MRLKLTLQRPGGRPVDIVTTVDATVTAGDLADTLVRADPLSGTVPVPDKPTLAVLRTEGAVAVDRSATVAESGIVSGDVVALVPASDRFRDPGDSAAAATLSVVGGPLAGAEFALPGGTSVIGRGPGCDVRLDDPMVSKEHARVTVSDVVELVDLNSSNGIVVGGGLTRRVVLAAGDTATLGDSVVTVTLHRRSPVGEDRSQGLSFNRSPRVVPRYEGVELSAPEPPERPGRHRFPLLTMLAPVAMGGLLFAFTRSPLSLMFAALGPVMLIGQFVESTVGGRRAHKEAVTAFRSDLADLEQRLSLEAAREVDVRAAEHPATGLVADGVLRHGPLLWTRRPEDAGFLELRVGLGALPSRTRVKTADAVRSTPALRAEVETVVARAATVSPVPVVAALRGCGSFGVSGATGHTDPLVRALLTQVAGLHSPAEVVVCALTDSAGAGRLAWLRWLPHTSSEHSPLGATPHLASDAVSCRTLVAALEAVVDQRGAVRRGAADPAPVPSVVVLVEDAAPADRSRLVQLAEVGPAAGVHLLWVAPSQQRLPAACRRFVDVPGPDGEGAVGDVATGSTTVPVRLEQAAPQDVELLARRLAPVVDAGARTDDDTDLPRSVSFLALSGPDLGRSAAHVVDRWREGGSLPGAEGRRSAGLGALVGQAGTDRFYLDLRTDGPHALVGGTTGAGKSEFLQSWVLGMAAAHSPQRVTFLFVDYKGGSAFGDCVHLPHCVGLVTDLTPFLVRRALASLKAELKHRERILEHYGAKDLVDLEEKLPAGEQVPPSLVIVVDEFAALVQEVPAFVEGVVDVAQRGRSLGLHLVLATQRPAGVIKDNLRANTNLRIALRMADDADSTDVIGTPQAAAIDASLPGRGYARIGPGRLVPFQSGYVGGRTADVPPPATVEVAELGFGLPARWEQPRTAAPVQQRQDPTDLQRVVAAIRQAAADAQIPPPRRPWRDSLADVYRLEQMPTRRTDTELVFGVQDDPQAQDQVTVAFRPDEHGNLAVFGTGGSGKSVLLRTLAIAAGYTVRGGPCHVYGLDFAGRGLAMLEGLPHVGSVVPAEDAERTGRLLRMLRDLVDERGARYSAVKAGSVTDYRTAAQAPAEPRILLLVDGISAFRQAYEGRLGGLWDVFLGIAGDGRAVGVHVVVSADQPRSVPSTLGAVIQKRVVLRLADRDDYGAVGVPTDALADDAPPGRGFLDGKEVQVALLTGNVPDPELARSVSQQGRAVERLAVAIEQAAQQHGWSPAPPVRSLTARVRLSDLRAPAPGALSVAVSDETLEELSIDLPASFLVAGPPGSGRTTALATLALAAYRSGRFRRHVHVGPARGQLPGLVPWDATASTQDEVQDLARRLREDLAHAPATLLVLENVPDWSGGAADTDLQAVVKAAAEHGHCVLAEGETTALSQGYGGTLSGQLKAARTGLLLQPQPNDGDSIFRTGVPRLARAETPPGRGYVIGPRAVTLVQMAIPE